VAVSIPSAERQHDRHKALSTVGAAHLPLSGVTTTRGAAKA